MPILAHAPHFSCAEAEHIANVYYGLRVTAKPLPSERDQNFKLTQINPSEPTAYVLKIANATESRETLEAQNAALLTAAKAAPCQRVVASQNGELICDVPNGTTRYLTRLLTWLPGVPLGLVKHQSPELLRHLGQTMGQVSAALADFDHAAAHRDFHWDVLNAVRVMRAHKDEITLPDRRALVEAFLQRFEQNLAPKLGELRRGIIHGDANDYNVVVDAGDSRDPSTRYTRVSGLLDFGDMVYSAVACEPAIAAAYALLDKAEPLQAVCDLVRGFHAVRPLAANELAAMWDLVCARLCMSVCHSAHQRKLRPSDDYLSISERPAWDALFKLWAIHPRLAHYALRDACGLPAHPDHEAVVAALRAHATAGHFAPVLGQPWAEIETYAFDLSVGNPLFGSSDIGASPQRFEALLNWAMASQNPPATVAVGGYDEARLIYSAPEFVNGETPDTERRTVHLGLDLWSKAETPIHAPLAGKVVAFHNNTARLDYGPVIILQHELDNEKWKMENGELELPAHNPKSKITFYTLYGHLSLGSLDGLYVGKDIAAGEVFAWMGPPPINGDWAPHLHMQVMLDLLDQGVDYIGVCRASQRSLWLNLSPDPNLILNLPAERLPATPTSKAQTLATRKERIGYNLSISYSQPLKIVRGLRQFLYDDTGRAYLDGVNNVCHVGHCHPQVVAAGQRQMAVLNTNTRYLHDSLNRYAERLSATLPPSLSVCFLVNSGSEANDLALRLARAYTGQRDMICVDAGYHGHTQALIEVSPYKHNGPGGAGRPAWVQMAQMPDPYRGIYKGYGRDTARAYAADVQRCVNDIRAQGRGVAGMICESMIGCGGQIVLPANYMADAAEIVHAAGGLFIADEVQVGFGRAGSHFWGFQSQGVTPDIVTMGKPAGNGHALGVVVTTPEVARAFANGMEYFNTFGGNPVSCEIGLAVLDVIEREGLQARAWRIGNYIVTGARALMPKFTLIGDVRGLGMYIGIELVLDRETLAPAGAHASYISNRMKDFGVFVSTDGPFHNVLKIKPPIIWTETDADHFLWALERVLAEDALQIA
ncbi:MAG: aminotransferase class III-fold pyridoxal phosphate-dependent enzyme [Anaerolineae bacterium]|nr:aminotransferase class III-fold pyridoxal phosphate-dependent enzyme [Anaerolineae bacterium]